ncbi:MAG TPA: protein phosphatase 2C domain-containing protein [Candidatus Lachnoclostridium stercorigallinarum]|mgnify:CR=1 FL=1|uniref:Protein phosphatase 2C domain-containing protein n=1 Tax=Candidatus Lachnoclostridium stercorigallinarum TaxID=2838634 RepID=A0A9D2GJN1_9FIRM|nr:protein phosphatase 2C domain-containing protein [Candidatus Lachnoclostridium stercorigallinarum]
MNIVKDMRKNDPRWITGTGSIIGTREYQQDYVYCCSCENGLLGVVCDGMGGLDGGEIASSTAAEALGEAFAGRDVRMPVPEFLKEQAVIINDRVAALTGKNGAPLRAGTTMVAVVAEEDRLYWLSVGDSRIYIIRNEEMSQVNREHNYRLTLQESLKSGLITREQYEAEEKKGQADALISYLGISRLSLMDINRAPLEMMDGDIVLLCSDGLFKSLSDSQIKALVRDNDMDLDIAADRLCQMAFSRRRGGQDNTSVLLLQYRKLEGQGRTI